MVTRFEVVLFSLIVGAIIGGVIGEKSQCDRLNKGYDWDSGRCLNE